jgi:tetratricopeptide (TPR) repeat protein
MLREHGALGIGRGAFATAYPRFKKQQDNNTYTHLENEYLQLPIDLGVPVGAGLLLCCGIAAFGWLRRSSRGPHQAAAVAALGGLSLHALTDFNLETLGVALPAAALAGMLAACTPAGALSRDRMPRRSSIFTLLPLPIAAVLLAILALTPKGTWSDRDAERLTKARGEPLPKFIELTERVIGRHPSDYLPYAMAGMALDRNKDASALKWLNRAMYLNPTHPGPHLVAARALRRLGHSGQALVEYRRALELGAPQLSAVLTEIAASYSSLDDLCAGVPDTAASYDHLAQTLRTAGQRDKAAAVAQRAHQKWPRDPAALHQLATMALERKQLGEAEKYGQDLLAVDDSVRSWLLSGSVLSQSGRHEEALRILQRARTRHPGEVEILASLSQAYVALKRFGEARKTAEEAGSIPGAGVAALARMHDQLAIIDEADGRPHRAAWERQQAAGLRGGGR